MKHVKLYNVIFPIWFLMFFPPVIFITLAGNFIIDSLVIIICYYAFKVSDTHGSLKMFYKNGILKVWLFGFLADFFGAAILFITGMSGENLGLPYEISSAISYDPFSHPAAVIIIMSAMLVSAVLIFLFNYGITFKKHIEEKQLRFKIALAIAVITMPWTFLLPTKWLYRGF